MKKLQRLADSRLPRQQQCCLYQHSASCYLYLGINLRRKLPYGADPSLQGFQPIYQSILFRLTLVALYFYILVGLQTLLRLEVQAH